MARIFPFELDAARAQGWARAELQTLDRLERELSDEYSVFHGVHWAKVDGGASVYGEIDFLIVNRYGRVLAIEQKNGPVEIKDGELVKTYASSSRIIRAQVSRNLNHLRTEFARRYNGAKLSIDHLVYCPEARLHGKLPAGIDPDRFVDATTDALLCQRIEQIFDAAPMPAGTGQADALDIHAYFSERVEVMPDIDAVSRQAKSESRRLAGGLTSWAQRLSMTPFRLRVSGTAGSGKTQLALAELRAASQRAQRALYVCYNRPLAESMRRIAPPDSQVVTFHELGVQALRAAGKSPDFSSPTIWNEIAASTLEFAQSLYQAIDVLIIDESQDLEGLWVESLSAMVKPQGRAVVLEDQYQRLYDREPPGLPGWVTLSSPVNYRSPQIIVTLIEQLGLVEGPLHAGGPIHGWDPQISNFRSDDELIRQTAVAVRQMIDDGHAISDIVVLSWQGMGRSVLMQCERIGDWRLIKPIGSFDDQGLEIHSEGTLRLETVHRFKGQSADCIVIGGVDFGEWSDEVRRRLFVAMTRARMRLALITTPEVEAMFVRHLSS